MFQDAREAEDGAQVDTDICIVGAGAAGITLARELIGTPLRVVVLESGGLELDERTQSLYGGENRGYPDATLIENRLRFFGGTTNHWAGHCRPPDPGLTHLRQLGPARGRESRRLPRVGGGWSSKCSATSRVDSA
jgi:choline dehydrogenase-like flavoprotein